MKLERSIKKERKEMNSILDAAEVVISSISNSVWPVFLPLMFIFGIYTAIRAIFFVRKKCTKKTKIDAKNIIGPASISLGNMIGTGAIIGVMGSLSKLANSGQMYVEALAGWGLIGACIMITVTYSEVMCSKIMHKTPEQYIGMLISPIACVIYAFAFVTLYLFGISGFQFSGIDAVITIITERYAHITLSQTQRYLYIIIPIVIFVSAIVLTKKHHIFINAMTYMIGFAVILYFAFFITFIIKTRSYLPEFFSRLATGMSNPVTAMLGIPSGLIFGMQRVLQTAETGIGSQAMAAQEADSKPTEAAAIALIPSIITVCAAILVTSYVCSYGIHVGIISLPAASLERLGGYFNTATSVTGSFGLIALSFFTILSALTTLLGSFYYLSTLFSKNKENKNITIYIVVVALAGTLAIFGFNIIFDAVDLLLFVVSALNITALALFVTKGYKNYLNKAEE